MHDSLLRVHRLPQHVDPSELKGSAAVVIDVLRATSTICQALASGALEAVPFLEPCDAIAACSSAKRNEIVLGGERQGMRIDGFELGNSPREYSPAAVGGRRVFFTTTNGTRAMHHAREADRVILASFLNLSAVAASVKNHRRIDILCAGTDGQETGEDILAAGGIVYELCNMQPAPRWQYNDTAAMAERDWCWLAISAERTGRQLSELLAAAMRDTPGGRNLIEIGLDQDVVDCAQINRLNIVPELDVREWRITTAHGGKSAS